MWWRSWAPLISSWESVTDECGEPKGANPECALEPARVQRACGARKRNRRTDYAVPAKTERLAHDAACDSGTVRLYLAASGGMDSRETRPAADQYLRASDFLPDAPAEAGRQISSADLPHLELRAGWLVQAAQAFLREARLGSGRARCANHGGWQIYTGICRMPRQLWHRAGDDVQ